MQGSRKYILALVASFALLVAACGGGSSESANNTSSEGSNSSGSESNSSGSTGNRDLGDISVGSFSGSIEDCLALSVSVASVGLLGVADALGGISGISESDINEAEQALSELEASIPSELESQFNTIRDAYENGLSFEDPEVDAAFTDISTFLEKECSDFGVGDLEGLGG